MNLSSRMSRCSIPLALTWNYAGAAYRVTPWPEVQFERRYGSEWVAIQPAAEMLCAAQPSAGTWRAYLEFVPASVRELLVRFGANRLLALRVAAHCPDLFGALADIPALLTFVGCHARLRGTQSERWDELSAQFERGGVFAVLDWLGLPATKPAMVILSTLISADLAPRLAEPLRAALWRPTGVLALAANGQLPDRQLTDYCPLAA
jgi:hypothetical protein